MWEQIAMLAASTAIGLSGQAKQKEAIKKAQREAAAREKEALAAASASTAKALAPLQKQEARAKATLGQRDVYSELAAARGSITTTQAAQRKEEMAAGISGAARLRGDRAALAGYGQELLAREKIRLERENAMNIMLTDLASKQSGVTMAGFAQETSIRTSAAATQSEMDMALAGMPDPASQIVGAGLQAFLMSDAGSEWFAGGFTGAEEGLSVADAAANLAPGGEFGVGGELMGAGAGDVLPSQVVNTPTPEVPVVPPAVELPEAATPSLGKKLGFAPPLDDWFNVKLRPAQSRLR